MRILELVELIRWDLRVNRGASWDHLRAMILLIEIRLEQFIHRWAAQHPGKAKKLAWTFVRGIGSLFQWFLCHSTIPGTIRIGRGLRLPHPQNIVLVYTAEIGEFCTIYHNVSVAWNGFLPAKPASPSIGDQVLIGTGAIIIGDVEIGSDVLVGAGTVVARSIPDHSRVVNASPLIATRTATGAAAQPASEPHLKDPYSLWR